MNFDRANFQLTYWELTPVVANENYSLTVNVLLVLLLLLLLLIVVWLSEPTPSWQEQQKV
jgi:hypothetical protein